jgi:hypothetical protein
MQQWLAVRDVTASTATLSKFLTGRSDRRRQAQAREKLLSCQPELPTEPDALGDPDPALNALGLLAQTMMREHATRVMADPEFSRRALNFVNRMSQLTLRRKKIVDAARRLDLRLAALRESRAPAQSGPLTVDNPK